MTSHPVVTSCRVDTDHSRRHFQSGAADRLIPVGNLKRRFREPAAFVCGDIYPSRMMTAAGATPSLCPDAGTSTLNKQYADGRSRLAAQPTPVQWRPVGSHKALRALCRRLQGAGGSHSITKPSDGSICSARSTAPAGSGTLINS